MALANPESIAHKPQSLSHSQAAALPLVGVSAWQVLEQPNSELMNQYGIKALFQFTHVNREQLTKLVQWVDQNNIMVNVEKTFLLDEAGKALDYQKDVHPRGKVVLTV
jgi:NADPH:quinone reductase-like Zn-dependent oxidoreductase